MFANKRKINTSIFFSYAASWFSRSLNIIQQPPTQFLDKPQPSPHFALPLPHLFLAKTFRLPHSYHFWKSWTPTHKGGVWTMSALLLKTLLPVGHQDVCLQKYHFWFWLIAAMFVYICTKCSGFIDWMIWRAI